MEGHEACGVFGIYAPGEDVARLTFYGLFALQHRGQESSGIATSDGTKIRLFARMGLVSQVFNEDDLEHLKGGYIAIGHNRYSTTGASQLANVQPVVINGPDGEIALAHNGNIINNIELHTDLSSQGYHFNGTTDSEAIAALIVASPGSTWAEKIRQAMRRIYGVYSLVISTHKELIGVRDPLGVRPLCLGKINDHWVIASESCALGHIGAIFIREVEPGEIVIINDNGLTSMRGMESTHHAFCVFEYIYFARPDSEINNRLVYSTRTAMGASLAQEYPVKADFVIGVPDSATCGAIGYADKSGIPFATGLVKNRYVGRTFIEPDQRIRDMGVRLKFNPLPEVLKGKRLVLVDDSIVRGTTTPRVLALLRKAGASEIHMRVCAPPIRFPCFFGVDMATRKELIAAKKTIPEIRDFIGADTLGYLSLPGLVKSVGLPRESLCLACLTGEYPIPVQLEMDKLALEIIQ